jgi:hypothetical protein
MITMNIHQPSFTHVVYDRDNASQFATIEIRSDGDSDSSYVAVFLNTETEADALIKAACLAKDALHAAKHAAAMAPLPDRGRYDAPSAEAVAEGAECSDQHGDERTRTPHTHVPLPADLAGTGLVPAPSGEALTAALSEQAARQLVSLVLACGHTRKAVPAGWAIARDHAYCAVCKTSARVVVTVSAPAGAR